MPLNFRLPDGPSGPDREMVAKLNRIWDDQAIDDEERARRLSTVTGDSLATSRAEIAAWRAWQATLTPEDVERIRASAANWKRRS